MTTRSDATMEIALALSGSNGKSATAPPKAGGRPQYTKETLPTKIHIKEDRWAAAVDLQDC